MPTVQGLSATIPERRVADALDSLNVIYVFQEPFFGGIGQAGGIVADFYLPEYLLIISILGEYYHYEMNRTGRDVLQSISVASQGIKTIFIDESSIMTDAKYYVQQALLGNDLSKLSRV